MNKNHPIALLKIGLNAYMAELLYEGHVFMNTAEYFSTLEDGTPRSDPDEGVGYLQKADGAILKMQDADEWCSLGTIAGAIRFRPDALKTTNRYCLHAKTVSAYGEAFQLNELKLGDSYVLFTNGNEFLKRLKKAVLKAGHECTYGMVNYIDRNDYTGPMSLFRKFSEFANTREFRVVVTPGAGGAMSLRLGDLSDIAIMGSANERLRLDPKVLP